MGGVNMRSSRGVVMVGLAMVVALSSCSSDDADNASTTSTAAPQVTTTTTTAAPSSVSEIGEALRAAANNRDAAAVAELAPTSNDDIRDFFIGGSPYEKVDCFVFDGKDQCQVNNGIADFIFTVDVSSGLVTDIEYVGGA